MCFDLKKKFCCLYIWKIPNQIYGKHKYIKNFDITFFSQPEIKKGRPRSNSSTPRSREQSKDKERESVDSSRVDSTGEVSEIKFSKGFEEGWIATEIIGALEYKSELIFLMKWKNNNKAEMVKAKDANIQCPQVVIKFYESRIRWDTDSTDS